MRRHLPSALSSLTQIWESVAAIFTTTSSTLETWFSEIDNVRHLPEVFAECSQRISHLLMIHTIAVLMTLTVYRLLGDALRKTGDIQWSLPCLDALNKSQLALKAVAKHVKVSRLVERSGLRPADDLQVGARPVDVGTSGSTVRPLASDAQMSSSDNLSDSITSSNAQSGQNYWCLLSTAQKRSPRTSCSCKSVSPCHGPKNDRSPD